MKRLLSLILEGSVMGALLGFFVSFINRNLPLSMLVGVIAGAIIRIAIDYGWKVYNDLTGKSLD